MDELHADLILAAKKLVEKVSLHTDHYRDVVSVRFEDDAQELLLSQNLMLSLSEALHDELVSSAFVNPNTVETHLRQIEFLYPRNAQVLRDDLAIAADDLQKFEQLATEIATFRKSFEVASKKLLYA